MTNTENLAARLDAVERSLTGGESTIDSLSDTTEVEERLDVLEATAADLDERVAELEAATQALRGYVGGVRAINRDVERRADAALAGVESLAERIGETPDDDAFEAVCAAATEESIGGENPESPEEAPAVSAGTTVVSDDPDDSANANESDLVTRIRDVL